MHNMNGFTSLEALSECGSPCQVQFGVAGARAAVRAMPMEGTRLAEDSTVHIATYSFQPDKRCAAQGPASSSSLHMCPCALRETLSCHNADDGLCNDVLTDAVPPTPAPARTVRFCSVLFSVWHAVSAQLRLATS